MTGVPDAAQHLFVPRRRSGIYAYGRWVPVWQRATPQVLARRKTRVNALMALRSIRGTNREQAVDALPTANPEVTRFFHQWLETFSGHVREVDYASASPLFHPAVLACGTPNDVIPGIDQWIRTQWDNVWPRTSDFRFTLAQSEVLASPDGAVAIVIAPWTSTGYQEDGKPFPWPGRATMVFQNLRMVGCARIRTCRSIAARRRPATQSGP